VTLLDTHVLIWLTTGDPRLGKDAKSRTDKALAEDTLAVSAMSFWEIKMLHQKGRIDLHQPIDSGRKDLLDLGILEIPVTGDIGIAAAALTDLHQDPADRIIIATAAREGALLLTADRCILDWNGSLRRQDARL